MKLTLRTSISLIAVAVAVTSVAKKPETPQQTLAEWAAEQTTTMPKIVEGVTMYRPEVNSDNMVINDFVDIKGQKGKQVFLKALMFARERLNGETERIDAVDFKNNRFTIRANRAPIIKRDQEQYSYIQAFQGAEGILSFSCGEMSVYFKEKGLIPRTLNFESLKPMTNDKHRDWIEGLSLAFSSRVEDLVNYIKTRPDISISHEQDIMNGVVVVGMNPDEVTLTLGKPFSVKKSGDRIKWLYDTGISIIFTNGKVSHVMM